jgi:hypothetical protein
MAAGRCGNDRVRFPGECAELRASSQALALLRTVSSLAITSRRPRSRSPAPRSPRRTKKKAAGEPRARRQVTTIGRFERWVSWSPRRRGSVGRVIWALFSRPCSAYLVDGKQKGGAAGREPPLSFDGQNVGF